MSFDIASFVSCVFSHFVSLKFGSLFRKGLLKSISAGGFPVEGWGVERNMRRCLFISALGFLFWTIEVCHIFCTCFMKDSASPLDSGSSALVVTLWCIPAQRKYCCSSCESFPLNGGPPSVLMRLQNPCLAKMSSKASIFASDEVLLTTAISGYFDNSSITTRTCFPSGVGPQ